jgi:hypothetical protein
MNTKHLNDRAKQRGISPLMMQALLTYGSEIYQKDGATRICYSEKDFKKLKKDLKNLCGKIDKLKSMFAVEVDGTLVTTGYRNGHLYK